LAAGAKALAEQVLLPLAEARPARYQRWDWDRDDYGERVDVPSGPVLLVEGSGSGSTPGARSLGLLMLFVAPSALRHLRGLARDGEAYRPHWQRWARQEDALFAAERTRERADLIIDTSVPHDACEVPIRVR